MFLHTTIEVCLADERRDFAFTFITDHCNMEEVAAALARDGFIAGERLDTHGSGGDRVIHQRRGTCIIAVGAIRQIQQMNRRVIDERGAVIYQPPAGIADART